MFPLYDSHEGSTQISYNDIAHLPPEKLSQLPLFYTFAFIRHPVSWLQSIFKHSKRHGWGSSPVRADTFNEFAQAYVTNFPKLVSRSMELYTKDCNFIGRQENLVNDLIIALKKADVKFNEEAIRNVAPVNTSPKSQTVYMSKETRRIIEASEAEFIDKYYKKN